MDTAIAALEQELTNAKGQPLEKLLTANINAALKAARSAQGLVR